jgi:hypothetical protein
MDKVQVREFMSAREAAEFLRIPYNHFRRLAPTLPRYAVTKHRYIYKHSDLLQWLESRRLA